MRIFDSRNLYKLWELQQLERVFRTYNVDCVFDIGANVGQYAWMIRKNLGFKGLIISFEPIPEAAALIRNKARGDSSWIVEEQVVGPRDGTQEFNVMRDSQFSSISTPRDMGLNLFGDATEIKNQIVVKSETLANAYVRMAARYKFFRPFLKMDTQGFDCEVVASGRRVLSQFVGLQSELAIKKIYLHSKDFREALALYESHGFSLSSFVPNNGGQFPHLVETDCIMIRNDLCNS